MLTWIASAGTNAIWIKVIALPVILGALALLLYITVKPFFQRSRRAKEHLDEMVAALQLPAATDLHRICITVDFSAMDQRTVATAVARGGRGAEYILIHVTESAVARYFGPLASDREALDDAANLQRYADQLTQQGYNATIRQGQGNSIKAIADIVNNAQADLLVMGAHGHRGLMDILLGSTVDAVRHRVKVPVLIVTAGS
jgi:manganese transport protein